jgi:hypothetical protein
MWTYKQTDRHRLMVRFYNTKYSDFHSQFSVPLRCYSMDCQSGEFQGQIRLYLKCYQILRCGEFSKIPLNKAVLNLNPVAHILK